MRTLMSTELRRMAARRLVRLSVLAALLAIGAAGIITAVRSQRVTPEVIARAEEEAERQMAACVAEPDLFIGGPPEGVDLEAWCRDLTRPEYFLDAGQQFELQGLPDILRGSAVILAIGGWLIGASFIGAEWNAGTMTTVLTWEPRRLRVLGAKTFAALAGVFVLAVGLQLLLSSAFVVVAALRGSTAGADTAWLRDLLGVGFRSATTAALAAVMALAVANIGRSTAAALGVGLAYLAVEGLVRVVQPTWGRWLLANNAATFIDGKAHMFFAQTGLSVQGDSSPFSMATVFVRTVDEAIAVVGVHTVMLIVLAAVVFHTRDL